MNKKKILESLKKSKFRSKFRLNSKYREYISKKGIKTIREHAYEITEKRISSKDIKNDGRQTPMKGHPVFIAQHATATCCRECIYKWHKIPKNRNLTKEEKEYIVNLIMLWINKELSTKDEY